MLIENLWFILNPEAFLCHFMLPSLFICFLNSTSLPSSAASPLISTTLMAVSVGSCVSVVTFTLKWVLLPENSDFKLNITGWLNSCFMVYPMIHLVIHICCSYLRGVAATLCSKSCTFLGNGHCSSFPNATVGSCNHEGASSHRHVQVLLHKALGGWKEAIPATNHHLPASFLHQAAGLVAHLSRFSVSVGGVLSQSVLRRGKCLRSPCLLYAPSQHFYCIQIQWRRECAWHRLWWAGVGPRLPAATTKSDCVHASTSVAPRILLSWRALLTTPEGGVKGAWEGGAAKVKCPLCSLVSCRELLVQGQSGQLPDSRDNTEQRDEGKQSQKQHFRKLGTLMGKDTGVAVKHNKTCWWKHSAVEKQI